ncbi:UNVERIFIED_CONTAM: hypothetical protein FKN15_045374, partial [Acipenser sinensis]
AYNIHVNGVLHCRVRYSQLLGLHEQLKKEYGNNVVPAFPPKKLFTLTSAEVEQRREQLEKYMQAVRQDPMLGASETFNSFLRKAQQETQQIPTEEVHLDVYLSNRQKVKVNILTSDQTEDVLETVSDIERGWILVNKEQHRQLKSLQEKGSKKEDSPDSNREPVVKLSSKLTSVTLRGISTSNSANDISGNNIHGNYAFEGIGDDDL